MMPFLVLLIKKIKTARSYLRKLDHSLMLLNRRCLINFHKGVFHGKIDNAIKDVRKWGGEGQISAKILRPSFMDDGLLILDDNI